MAGNGWMCGFIAQAGVRPFQRISRSLRIEGHSTSIQLEAAFWAVLDVMAEREGVTTPKLIAALHGEAAGLDGTATNFASTLRTVCLLYQSAAAE